MRNTRGAGPVLALLLVLAIVILAIVFLHPTIDISISFPPLWP
jgi:hypothetical protein